MAPLADRLSRKPIVPTFFTLLSRYPCARPQGHRTIMPRTRSPNHSGAIGWAARGQPRPVRRLDSRWVALRRDIPGRPYLESHTTPDLAVKEVRANSAGTLDTLTDGHAIVPADDRALRVVVFHPGSQPHLNASVPVLVSVVERTGGHRPYSAATVELSRP